MCCLSTIINWLRVTDTSINTFCIHAILQFLHTWRDLTWVRIWTIWLFFLNKESQLWGAEEWRLLPKSKICVIKLSSHGIEPAPFSGQSNQKYLGFSSKNQCEWFYSAKLRVIFPSLLQLYFSALWGKGCHPCNNLKHWNMIYFSSLFPCFYLWICIKTLFWLSD